MQESTQRRAVVVDHAPETTLGRSSANRAVFSVVEFVDDEGTRRTAQTNVSSYPAPNAIGEEIEVRIHHTRLDDVRVVSFTGLWFESAFYLIPGFLTLLIGFALVLKKSRKT